MYSKILYTHSFLTSSLSVSTTSYILSTWISYLSKEGVRTLIMTTSVDRKSEGLDAGSNTDELDWRDWKRPLMSRLRAKLLRNKTYNCGEIYNVVMKGHSVTHEIRNSSIEKYEKYILLGWTLETVDACCSWIWYNREPLGVMHSISPSKSSATISASSVGDTDIHTPSK